ncbi:MAG: YitT family protein [Christensenellales bacterium]
MKKFWDRNKDYFFVIGGTVMIVLALNLFLIPNKIAPGGVSGAATILHYVVGWPVGAVTLGINIVLFAIAFKDLGKSFGLKSLGATILFGVLLDVLQLKPLTADPFLACIYGGVIMGLGMGLVFRGNASTGGTDILAMLVYRRAPVLGIGWIVFLVDFFVVVGAGIAFDPELALYALATLYLSSHIVEFVLEGINYARAFLIISDHPEAIQERIFSELQRGITLINGQGGYRKTDKQLILCVLEGRQEIILLKKIIKEEDPKAFVIISDVHEISGEGFGKRLGK